METNLDDKKQISLWSENLLAIIIRTKNRIKKISITGYLVWKYEIFLINLRNI